MALERPTCSTTLRSLSDELILLILRNFCAHCREGPHESQYAYLVETKRLVYELDWYALDVSALCSMTLVSKRFSPLAQEVLYHEFAPGHDYYSTLDERSSEVYDWYWRLEPFLRIVAQNPARAAFVKRLHVNANVLCCVVEDGTYEGGILKDVAQARGIDIYNFAGFFEALRPQIEPYRYLPQADALLGMLLTCLPRLKTLTFSTGAPLLGVPASALRAAGLSALRIQTLGIIWCDDSLEFRLGGILELASATIRNLRLNSCNEQGLSGLTRHGPFPNLRSFCIANSRVSGSDLASFLSCHVDLETCSYHSGTFPAKPL